MAFADQCVSFSETIKKRIYLMAFRSHKKYLQWVVGINYLSCVIKTNRMKKYLILFILLASGVLTNKVAARIDPKTLEIGAPAPDFVLPATDGKKYSLKDFQ